ncbi:MAG: PIN domain-containing protein [Rhizobiaceae bacterium]|nr:PIN domain-containing protein [Rhizobiaceae bacterium]
MIFLDTNVISETLKRTPEASVKEWLFIYDSELALPTVVIAEVAFGIHKIREHERAGSLERSLSDWRRRLADRIFGLTEAAALAYGEIVGRAARQGRSMSTADGMIAAIVKVNGGRLATRNIAHFETTGLELISPWEF